MTTASRAREHVACSPFSRMISGVMIPTSDASTALREVRAIARCSARSSCSAGSPAERALAKGNACGHDFAQVGAGRPLSGAPCRLDFERDSRFGECGDVVAIEREHVSDQMGERRDAEAGDDGAALRMRLENAVELEPTQRLPDVRAADAELHRELALGQEGGRPD